MDLTTFAFAALKFAGSCVAQNVANVAIATA